MAPPEFYKKLVAFATKYDIWVIHDNAYSELVYDHHHCMSFLSYAGAKEIGVEFNSLSKTYGMAGARIGFCVGNAALVGKLAALKSNMDYGMFIPSRRPRRWPSRRPDLRGGHRRAYERRRNFLCDGLTAIGWPVTAARARCSSGLKSRRNM